jgi:hypothetical protein
MRFKNYAEMTGAGPFTDAYDAVVGDVVWCDWRRKGHYTKHTIKARQSGMRSQTKVCFIVDPPVHKPDTSNAWRDLRGDWIDSAWFHRSRP